MWPERNQWPESQLDIIACVVGTPLVDCPKVVTIVTRQQWKYIAFHFYGNEQASTTMYKSVNVSTVTSCWLSLSPLWDIVKNSR